MGRGWFRWKNVRLVLPQMYEVGFKSVPHFCTKFRAQYGETPSGYRRARVDVVVTRGPTP